MVTRIRIWVAILAAALVAGACGAGAATPGPTTAGPVAADPVGFSATAGPMSSHRFSHTATLLHSGKVLIAGGADTSGLKASAELYDPSTDSFTVTGSLSSPRLGHTATLLANGKVLIAGGRGAQAGEERMASAELYDPATGSFSLTGSMLHPRSGHTATLLADGEVLIVGGASAYAPADLSSAELYDPDTGTFKPTGSMTSPRDGQTGTLLASGKVLLTGGIAGASVVASAELYDPAAGSFSSTGSMSSPRWAHTATLLSSGKVLIVGGSTYNTEGDFLASAELYDPATGSFSPTGSMPGPRIGHTATLLTSGKVLIAGGVGAPFESDLASAELYEPATGSFSPIGSMTMVRSGYTATLLQSGRVLIAGGDSNGTVAWAELSVGPSASQPMPTGSPEASASPTNAAFSTRSPNASASPTPGVPMAIDSIDWQTGEQLPGMRRLQGALGLDDEVLAFGDTHIPGRVAGYEVGAIWSSTDGLTWTLVTGPDAFSKVGSSILSVSSDGHGGLLAAGYTYSETENYLRHAVWHSSDGLAWTPVDLGSPEGGSSFQVAANSRIAVVEGSVWTADRWQRYVWSSTDGVSWSSTELPSADNSQPGRAPLLAGGAAGFEILETGYGDVPGHAWHSDDGRTWVETQPPALEGAMVEMGDPTSLIATDGGFVAVGVEGGPESAKPAAWATVDGKTWTKSVMEDPGDRFGCMQICRPTVVTQVGRSLIAVGYAKKDTSDDLSPAATVVVWISEDAGRTWKLQGTGPADLVPAVAATLHSEPIVLDAWLTMRSFRGSIVWKSVAAAGGS